VIQPFDVGEDLPPGITVLQASAGTGKTHAVASLVTRAVALGTPLERILVVTFTRKATGTLRERVWHRLTDVATALEAPAASTDDGLVRHLRVGAPEELSGRAFRLRAALSGFDSATIATTHGFCQQVLASLGVAGDAERGAEVVDDVRDLVDDAVADLFIRRFHTGGDLSLDPADARILARAVIANPEAELAQVDRGFAGDVIRRQFASSLRGRVADQKRRARLVTYDDLLTRLRDSLTGDLRDIVGERLRRRYTMAVVDEFQDTDVVQWQILESAFGGGESRLILVGDPKQSIYAFRGGDVHAYLAAVDRAGAERSLPVSWRADQPLLDAMDLLLGRPCLGDPRIRLEKTSARPGAEQRRLIGPDVGAPMRVRVVRTDGPGLVTVLGGRAVQVGSARTFVARDLAATVAEMLAAGTKIVERSADGTLTGRPEDLRVNDLAVLVRTKVFAEQVRDELVAIGIPAVVHGGPSVLGTEAARCWLTLLDALDRPTMTVRLHALARSPFVGWSADRIATTDEDGWEDLREQLHSWTTTFRLRGVAALLHQASTTGNLPARLLAENGGERLLSDLRHVGELLHNRHSAHPGSLTTLAGWLHDEVDRARGDDGDEGRRRLSSDADAIAVMTIHSAKGLEFPIVLLPSAWEPTPGRDEDVPVFHDPDGTRCIGVGQGGREASEVQRRQMETAAAEQAGEDMRLLYVALTRARHQVVLWWVSGHGGERAALARILLGAAGADGVVPDALRKVPTHEDVRVSLEELAERSPDVLSVEEAAGARAVPTVAAAHRAAATTLGVRTFVRPFDDRWTRTSYSALTAAAHDAGPHTTDIAEIDEGPLVDEPAPIETGPDAGDGAEAGGLPLGEIIGGARFGSLVHEMLEGTDFAADDLEAELARECGRAGASRLLNGDTGPLVTGLVTALSTPLGPLFDDRSLRSIQRSDRLDELSFDLPLAGGDRPQGSVTMDAIADVFSLLPADDPLAGYCERLREPVLAAEVRGFLTGSIDLVARIADRYVVVDYKSNRLAPSGVVLTPRHYGPKELALAMQDAHYPLQAMLYAVALHRFLRWRLPSYEPDTHLGGIAYLFLRGMAGEGAPGSGVFSWRPAASMVIALSDLLDRGTA